MTKQSKTCGDFGGVKKNGQPCTRPAGWGRDGVDKGRCKAHCDAKDEKKERVKKEFLDYYESNITTIKKAAAEVGRSVSTIWRYRKDDEWFDEKVREAAELQDEKRGDVVEDAVFKQIMEGDASAALIIFWLKNRMPERWRDDPDTQVNISNRNGFDSGELADRVREKLEEFDKQ